MANICNTDIRFYGNADNIKRLTDDLVKTIKKSKETHYYVFRTIARDLLNYTDEDIISKGYNVRGDLEIEKVNDNVELLCYSESKWSPCDELIKELADKYDVEVYWRAEEWGCDIFLTNDVDGNVYDQDYIFYNENIGEEYCKDEANLIELAKQVNPSISTIEDVDNCDDISYMKITRTNG